MINLKQDDLGEENQRNLTLAPLVDPWPRAIQFCSDRCFVHLCNLIKGCALTESKMNEKVLLVLSKQIPTVMHFVMEPQEYFVATFDKSTFFSLTEGVTLIRTNPLRFFETGVQGFFTIQQIILWIRKKYYFDRKLDGVK